MHANHDQRPSDAVDHEAFQKVIRDNLSPQAVAAIVAFLEPAALRRAPSQEAREAMHEVEWFADALRALIGIDEHGRLMDELGL